MNADICRRTN